MSGSNGRPRRPSVAIVGGGFGGVGAATVLAREGYEDVTVFEKRDRVGGVWEANRRNVAGRHRFFFGSELARDRFGAGVCDRFSPLDSGTCLAA